MDGVIRICFSHSYLLILRLTAPLAKVNFFFLSEGVFVLYKLAYLPLHLKIACVQLSLGVAQPRTSWTIGRVLCLFPFILIALYNLLKLDWKCAYKWRKSSLPGVWLNFAPVESIFEWRRFLLRNSALNSLLVHAYWVWFLFLPYCFLMDRWYRALN